MTAIARAASSCDIAGFLRFQQRLDVHETRQVPPISFRITVKQQLVAHQTAVPARGQYHVLKLQ